MNAETVSTASTGTAITSVAVATGAATGWIGQVNEWIPLAGILIACGAMFLNLLIYLERRKQTRMMEKHMKDGA
jgi:hypothetical protein